MKDSTLDSSTMQQVTAHRHFATEVYTLASPAATILHKQDVLDITVVLFNLDVSAIQVVSALVRFNFGLPYSSPSHPRPGRGMSV